MENIRHKRRRKREENVWIKRREGKNITYEQYKRHEEVGKEGDADVKKRWGDTVKRGGEEEVENRMEGVWGKTK